MKGLCEQPFKNFSDDWALLTAGDIDNYNTMTIGWGAMGTIWGLSAITVYVRLSRYTLEYMEDNDLFTVSFFDKSFQKDLALLGSKSGRDGDKVALTKLTAVAAGDGAASFEQAKRTYVCRKMLSQDIPREAMPDEIIDRWYSTEDIHRMYIGEIIDVIEG